MRDASATKETKDRYHHGSLREALVTAALALIEKEGVGALTLREVARRAGVTHAAPYRHFADKSAILAAVAAEGFRALIAKTERAMDGVTDVRKRFLRSGVAYVRFAVEHPAHFRVMFGQDHAANQDPARCAASGEAFGQLLASIVDCQKAGVVRRGDSMEMAVVAWSFVHGLASLLVDQQLPPMPDVEGFVELSVKRFAEGIAPPPTTKPTKARTTKRG